MTSVTSSGRLITTTSSAPSRAGTTSAVSAHFFRNASLSFWNSRVAALEVSAGSPATSSVLMATGMVTDRRKSVSEARSAASQGPVLGGVVEQPVRLDAPVFDLEELGEAHDSARQLGLVKDCRLPVHVDLLQNIDRPLQAFDESLQAADESCGGTPPFARDRAFEGEVLGEDARQTLTIERGHSVLPAVVVLLHE